MEKLKVEFQNCYGISKLDYDFNFNLGPVYSVYSPNGSMKTSFAQIFRDFSEGLESKDVIFPHRPTVRNIECEAGEIEKQSRKKGSVKNDSYSHLQMRFIYHRPQFIFSGRNTSYGLNLPSKDQFLKVL